MAEFLDSRAASVILWKIKESMMTQKVNPTLKIFGLKYQWYIIGALGLSYYNLSNHPEDSIARTKETADSIHGKTMARVEAGQIDAAAPVINEYKYDGFLQFKRVTTRGEEGRLVCVTETEGLRIPYRKTAITSSVGTCSVGEFAAKSWLHGINRGTSFRY